MSQNPQYSILKEDTETNGKHEVVYSEGENEPNIELVSFNRERDEVQIHGILVMSESEDDTKELIPIPSDEDGLYVDYEAVLQVVGFGLFHILLLLALGVALSSDAVEILSISFIIPILRHPDEMSLTDFQDGLLSSVVFVGMLVGSYLWGGIADLSGRRYALLMSLSVNSLFGFVSAFSPNIIVLLLFRFLSGIGVGGSLPIIMPYCSEFVHSNYRGQYIATLSAFWMVGGLLCGGIAWLLLPLNNGHFINWSIGIIRLSNWRIFLMVSAFPAGLGALLFIVLPESPRYLLEADKGKKALNILRQMYNINNWRHRSPSIFPVKHIKLNIEQSGNWFNKAKTGKCWKHCHSSAIEVLKRTLRLFEKSLLRATVPLLIIYFCLSYGSYGVTLWFPTYVDYLNKQAQGKLCNQTVPNMTLNTDKLASLCSCSATSYQSVELKDVSISGWHAANTSIMDSTVKGGTYTTVTFTGVQLQNVTFLNSNLQNAWFVSGSWADVQFINANLTGVELCNISLGGNVYIRNSTVNDQAIFNETVERVFHISVSEEAESCRDYENRTDNCSQLTSNLFDDYQNTFFITAAALPGNIAAAVALNFARRSFLLAFFLGMSMVSVFLLYLVHSKVVSVVVLCLFTAISTPGWNVGSVVAAEVYPTSLRTTATGVHLLMARIGAIIGTYFFGQFSDEPTIPILVTAAILFIGTVNALFLPKTNKNTKLK